MLEHFKGFDSLESVHESRIHALHEIGDYEARDRAVDALLSYWEGRVTAAADRAGELRRAAASLDRLSKCPWVVEPVESDLFRKLVSIATRHVPVDQCVETLKEQALKRKEVASKLCALEAIRQIPGCGLSGFTKFEAYRLARLLTCSDRRAEALMICEMALAMPGRHGIEEWILMEARNLARALGRDDEARAYTKRLAEEYP
jgi:hypothetical protein